MRGLSDGDPRLCLLRGLRCRDGADQMLDDTNAAYEALPPGHPWRPAAVLGRAAALLLAGDTARAESELVLAIELATAAGATELTTLGLCLRSLLAVEENERADAEAFADEAASISTVEPPPRRSSPSCSRRSERGMRPGEGTYPRRPQPWSAPTSSFCSQLRPFRGSPPTLSSSSRASGSHSRTRTELAPS